MDIEQLKMIIEALGAAGAGTKHLIIVYFAYLFAKLTFTVGLIGAVVTAAYKIIRHGIDQCSFSNDVAQAIDTYGCLSGSERRKAIKYIRAGMESDSK